MPPVLLVLGGIASVQVGAALATSLFDDVGVGGSVLLRVVAAAIVLAILSPPRMRGRRPGDLGLAVAFGLVLAGMNLAFYSALDRIPLGIAVALEFVGPLGVAAFGSPRRRDLVWVALAAAGILLLAPVGGGGVELAGVMLALLAGAFWASYILLSVRVGRVFDGGSGLALAMVVAAVPLLPIGVAAGGADLLDPGVLAAGAAVGVLSSAIPYGLELQALRTLPASVFGVLMSLEPAVATLAGFLLLAERLDGRELLAVALVVTASAGAARRPAPPPPAEPR